MKIERTLLFAALILLTFVSVSILFAIFAKSELQNIVYTSANSFECTYDGEKHDVILDLPEDTLDAPLILMLHGYGGTSESFRFDTKIHEIANPEGYAVAYVTGAADKSQQTTAVEWNSGLSKSTNKDVEFLVALVSYLENTYGFNPSRTYAVGFSNGAYMTHRLAVEAPDTFEAVVSVAGSMAQRIWDTRPVSTRISILQITGTEDAVVPQELNGSASSNPNPSIEKVLSYYITSDNLSLSSQTDMPNSTLIKYDDDAEFRVWHLVIDGGHHSWPTNKNNGFDAGEVVMEFLNTFSR